MLYSQISPELARGRQSAPTLSIVVPCYNEEAALPLLLNRLKRLGRELRDSGRTSGALQIILVDDGSSDATWPMIKAAQVTHSVTGLRLSRNHGHQRALLAGLMAATTDIAVSMDADLQDNPDVVLKMVDAYMLGAEIVYGVRASRATDTAFKRITAQGYYRFMSILGVDLIPDHADFRLMSRKALEALGDFQETNLFLRGLVPQLGFASTTVKYDRAARSAGISKYPLVKMLGLAIEGVTSFSVKPLRIITWIGFAVAALSFAYAVYSLIMWTMGATIPGWASTVIPLYLLGGLHLIALGVIGEYVGKIYQESKRRPRFIIDELARAEPDQQTFEKTVSFEMANRS